MNSKALVILISAIVIILLAAGSWYFWPKDKTAQPASPTNLTTESQDKVIPTTPEKQTPTETPGKLNVKIFLVALDDQGKSGDLIGCGDSAVAVTREINFTQATLKASLNELLAQKDQYYGQSGLYNALAASSLTLSSAEVANGRAVVKLTGELKISGVCEGPRIKAQLEETAKQFSTVKSVQFFINDKDLTEILSQQGA